MVGSAVPHFVGMKLERKKKIKKNNTMSEIDTSTGAISTHQSINWEYMKMTSCSLKYIEVICRLKKKRESVWSRRKSTFGCVALEGNS